jgi:hypothetical protein
MKHLCRQSLTTWMRPVNSCTFSDQVEADADAVDVVGDDPILSWPSYGSWSHDKKWWSGSRHCWHWSYGKGAGKREWWWSKGLQDDTASDRWYESVAEGEGSLAVMAGATGRKSICPLYPKVAGAVRRPWTPEDTRRPYAVWFHAVDVAWLSSGNTWWTWGLADFALSLNPRACVPNSHRPQEAASSTIMLETIAAYGIVLRFC